MSRPRLHPGSGPPPWDEGPRTGELSPSLLSALSDSLAAHTSTRQRCWFCLWDGWNYGPAAPAVATGPRVRAPQRDYILFEGPLEAAGNLGRLVSGSRFVSPNVCWPDDHAWCVATEVDLDSTYVGGSRGLAEMVLGDARLEAWPVNVTDPITADSDDVNQR